MASLAFSELDFFEPFETSVASVCPTMSPCTCASSLLLQKQSIATEKTADEKTADCFDPLCLPIDPDLCPLHRDSDCML